MAIKSDYEYIIILERANFRYTPDQIEYFIWLWNEGYSYKLIAKKMKIARYEVALLAIHCDLEDLIGERPGDALGTIRTEARAVKNETEKMVIK